MFLGIPDPLDRGTDPRIRIRIRIRTKMPRSHNTEKKVFIFNYLFTGAPLTKKSMVEILSLMKYGNLIMPRVTPQIFVNIGDY
jgi:hypothetical protein